MRQTAAERPRYMREREHYLFLTNIQRNNSRDTNHDCEN